jgi:Ca2+-binding RTX toxin-like protein
MPIISGYNLVTTTARGLPIDNSSNEIKGTEYGDPAANGDDLIRAGAGNDRIYANGGNDLINAGRGNDVINGGWGNDTFVFEAGSGNDTISDFGFNPAGNIDHIEVEGTYLGARSSFLGTTLSFDYNGDSKADGSVLLLGVSANKWSAYLAAGALEDTSSGKAWSDNDGSIGAHAALFDQAAGALLIA